MEKMRHWFFIIFIFLFSIQQRAFSSQLKQIAQANKQSEQLAKTNCHLSARSQKKIRSYKISSISDFLNEKDIQNLLDMHLDDIEKGWPNKCPKSCKAVNDYSILAKTYPLSVNEKSCDTSEAKESYHFNKQFPIRGNSESDKHKAYKQTRDWVFSIFVDPYYPFAKNFPKEFTENKIDKACPSCSFYFSYVYKYTKDNKLDLSLTARCGDKRTFFSAFQSEFILVNKWKCENKP